MKLLPPTLLLALALTSCDDAGRLAAVAIPPGDVQGARLDAPLEREAAEASAPKAEVVAVVNPTGEEGAAESSPEERLEAADYEVLDDGTVVATFLDLDFPDYLPPDQREPDEPEVLELGHFPDRIQLLDDRRVSVEGFMLVANWKDKEIERFMLGRFPPGCCFGAIPVYYEWIDVVPEVALTEDYSPWFPISVTGTLDVGEVTDEDGYVESIYRLKCESVLELE